MNYPIFAPSSTWYSQGGTTVEKTTFTEITILDSYTPTGEESESWNADVNNNGDIKCYIKGTKLIIAGNGSGKLALNEDSSYMFSNLAPVATDSDSFKNLLNINGLDILDTSNSKDMSYMFFYCQKLQSILVNNWDTSNCEDFLCMFNYCNNISELNLSNFNTKKGTKMQHMFYAMNRLKKVILGSNFNFSGNGSASPRAILPTPHSDYITGTDGLWHSEDCITYNNASVPNETKMTYYAIPAEVPTIMTIKYGTMFNIAESYRSKVGTTNRLAPSALASGIKNLSQLDFSYIEIDFKIDSGGHIVINKGNLPCNPEKIICIYAFLGNDATPHLMAYDSDYKKFYFTYISSSNNGISFTTATESAIVDSSNSISWLIDPNLLCTGQLVYIEKISYIK